MTPDRAVEQLQRLAQLLDRARENARVEGQDLEALLMEASHSLRAVDQVVATASAPERAALLVAARRARASQVALEQTLREELARVGRQLANAPAPARASRYQTAPASTSAQHLDKVG